MKKYLIIAVIIMSIIQLCVPAYMMINRFDTQRTGTLYKFKVAPVDPYDAFRGRYLAIRVETQDAKPIDYKQNAKVFAVLDVDENGFARVERVETQKPTDGSAYINAKYRYGRLELPFDRYYMEEKLAPAAETAYRRQTKDAYITVKVKNGNSVIEGLFIENTKIEDYVKNLE